MFYSALALLRRTPPVLRLTPPRDAGALVYLFGGFADGNYCLTNLAPTLRRSIVFNIRDIGCNQLIGG